MEPTWPCWRGVIAIPTERIAAGEMMTASRMDTPGTSWPLPTEDARYTPVDRVRVNAGETFALLLHAARTNRSWINDFADETFEVSRDMYEILLAFKRLATEENARAA